jgi:hypothetical protein
VLFRNYKIDENSRPRKQARLDTNVVVKLTAEIMFN